MPILEWRYKLLRTVFPAKTRAFFLPNLTVCLARNLFVPRDFPSRKHPRILSDSIADPDSYRIGSLAGLPFKTDLYRKVAQLLDHYPKTGS